MELGGSLIGAVAWLKSKFISAAAGIPNATVSRGLVGRRHRVIKEPHLLWQCLGST